MQQLQGGWTALPGFREGYRGGVPFTAMGLGFPPDTEQRWPCEPTDFDITQYLSFASTD